MVCLTKKFQNFHFFFCSIHGLAEIAAERHFLPPMKRSMETQNEKADKWLFSEKSGAISSVPSRSLADKKTIDRKWLEMELEKFTSNSQEEPVASSSEGESQTEIEEVQGEQDITPNKLEKEEKKDLILEQEFQENEETKSILPSEEIEPIVQEEESEFIYTSSEIDMLQKVFQGVLSARQLHGTVSSSISS